MHKDVQRLDVSTMLESHFRDQSKLCIEFGDRGALVWRTKEERYNPARLKRSVNFPTSVMVWGCTSISTRCNIVFLKLTVYIYTILCIWKCWESPSFIHTGSVRYLYGDEDMIFQQDLDPAHEKGQDMATIYLQVLDWPANSLDLNIIEEMWTLWRDT